MKDGPEQWSGLKQDDLAIHARSRSVELAHRFYGRVSMCQDRMMLKKKKKEGRKIIQRRWVEYSQGGLMSQNEDGVYFGIDQNVEIVPYL